MRRTPKCMLPCVCVLNHHRQSFGYLLYILILISPILTMLFSATSRQLTSSASRAVLWKRLFPATRTQSTSVVVASSWTQADVQLRDRYNTPQQEPLDANEVRRILSEVGLWHFVLYERSWSGRCCSLMQPKGYRVMMAACCSADESDSYWHFVGAFCAF